MLIHHHEIHQKVQRKLFKTKSIQRHIELFLCTNIARQGEQQSVIRRGNFLTKFRGKLRHRHAVATYFLRQSFQQLYNFFCQQTRHQIFAARRRYLINQRQRYSQRHPVIAFTRCKIVAQGIAHIVHHQLRRKLVGSDTRCFVPHQIIFLQVQQFWRFALGLFAPNFKCCTVVDVRWNAAVIKGEYQFIIHQHIGTARFMF